MKILFLGHFDIASLTAINKVIIDSPDHRHHVWLSVDSNDDNPLLEELAAADLALCNRFLDGEFTLMPDEAICNRPVNGFERPNSSEGLARIRDLAPDLIVSIRYRQILRDEAIAVPPKGVINLHSGILPDYRGVMATFWAMLDGAPEIGTTLHRISDSGVDTGPVVEINRQPVRPDRSYLANVLSLYPAGCAAIVAAIEKLAAGEGLDEQQQPAGGRYFRAPNEGSVCNFTQNGYSLVDGNEAEVLIAAP